MARSQQDKRPEAPSIAGETRTRSPGEALQRPVTRPICRVRHAAARILGRGGESRAGETPAPCH